MNRNVLNCSLRHRLFQVRSFSARSFSARSVCLAVLVGLLFGCSSVEAPKMLQIDQLRPPKTISAEPIDNQAQGAVEEISIEAGPASTFTPGVASSANLKPRFSTTETAFRGSYNNMSVAAFINEVFGNQLGLSFTIDPDVQGLSELVSLRLIEEVTADRLFSVAQGTLASYGVAIGTQADLYVFSLSAEATAGDLPLVISGRALPEVPPTHRPLFVFVPITVVNSNALKNWLTPALRGQDLKMTVVSETNGLLLQGKQSDVEQALSMIELLDQPALRGSFSAIVEPVFADADGLAKDIVDVLRSEGYEASVRPPTGGVMVLPMKSSNKIVVLAASREVLSHATQWAQTLDRSNTSGIENGIFSYQARNTDVTYLVSLLNQLDAGGAGSRSEGAELNVAAREDRQPSAGRFIPDTNRNAVVYRGSGREWMELLPAIMDMDKPAPSVLVEVILAEVTLNDQDETGIEFLARSGDVTFSTLRGLGLGGNGLTATLNRAGETRAVLNAFYQSDRANIRSRPRLMVKSGQQASIDVGNEIPFVSSTSQSTDNPDSPVIQTVSYRKTGVILSIEPVVHSSGYVDIRISQELSEAQQTSTSSIDSPTIFNRRLETTVTLRDGGSVLLGGLISESNADSNNGIKGLGRIPGFGRLFRADSSSTDKTELVMMVIPYVVENPDEAAEITDRALEFLELTR